MAWGGATIWVWQVWNVWGTGTGIEGLRVGEGCAICGAVRGAHRVHFRCEECGKCGKREELGVGSRGCVWGKAAPYAVPSVTPVASTSGVKSVASVERVGKYGEVSGVVCHT